MKIIGGNDYYDGAGYGVDETVVLVRDRSTVLRDVENTTDHPFGTMKAIEYYSTKAHQPGRLQPITVFFAGEIYRGLADENYERFDHRTWEQRPLISPITFDIEGALTMIDERADGIRQTRALASERFIARIKQDVRQFFSQPLTANQLDWAIESKTFNLSCAAHDNQGRTIGKRNHACLKELQFFKAMDPFTAHMRLSNYIGGVLTSSREVITLSDQDLLQKRGFDKVKSFRKAPQE